MLATQLNSLITDGQIDEYCVIRVNKHNCNNMQGKKVIIILELDILRSGAQVGQKIGSPVPIQQDGTINENDKKAQESMKKTRKSTEDESNDGQPASDELKVNKSLLECNVCLEVPSSNPIYQCRNGHLFCKECHSKLQECPVCRQGKKQLGNVICLIAQKILDKE